MSDSKKTLVLGITASVAIYRVCDLILMLRDAGVRVLPIMTPDAAKFVTPLLIQSVAAEKVVTQLLDPAENTKPVHTELAKKADALAIIPASADILAQLRIGLAGNIVSCTVLASDAPILLAPAMNDKMYANAATQENIKVLKERGMQFVDPVEGRLICNDHAMGHIADNETILQSILDVLKLKK